MGDDTALPLNGEIYNFREMVAELSSHKIQSTGHLGSVTTPAFMGYNDKTFGHMSHIDVD